MSVHELEQFRITAEGGIVKMWHGRSVRDEEEAERVTSLIDQALRESGFELLLFDSREADRTAPEVQAVLWEWLSGHESVRRLGVVQQSADLSRRLRRRGAMEGVWLKSFSDEESARKWLLEVDLRTG